MIKWVLRIFSYLMTLIVGAGIMIGILLSKNILTIEILRTIFEG